MEERLIVVFATSFLDEPVAAVPRAGAGAKILAELQSRSDKSGDFGGNAIRVIFRCERSPAEPLSSEELQGVTAVIADLERYPAELLSECGLGAGGTLELIARYGVGYESVDVEAATATGVLVTNTPGANTLPTAEWSVATLLDVAGRRLPHHERASKGGAKSGLPRLDVSGKTIGIVGAGAVGRRVARLMSGFGLRLLAYDLYPDHQWAKSSGARFVELPELLRECDFVTLHAATSDRIIGSAELALMRPSAVLVNCARGVLVDNRAAYAAVSEGRLWGYGLDEVWTEHDLPLEGLNIVVSPHVGSDTDAGKAGMQVMSAQAVADYMGGKSPEHLINPDALKNR